MGILKIIYHNLNLDLDLVVFFNAKEDIFEKQKLEIGQLPENILFTGLEISIGNIVLYRIMKQYRVLQNTLNMM